MPAAAFPESTARLHRHRCQTILLRMPVLHATEKVPDPSLRSETTQTPPHMRHAVRSVRLLLSDVPAHVPLWAGSAHRQANLRRRSGRFFRQFQWFPTSYELLLFHFFYYSISSQKLQCYFSYLYSIASESLQQYRKQICNKTFAPSPP